MGQCPPEDIGGVGGFYSFREAMADPSHPEHDAMRAWLGADEFATGNPSVDEINRALVSLAEAEQGIAQRNGAGLDDLAGLSPNALHALLYQTFGSPDVLQWVSPDAPEAAPIIRMLQALLEAMGDKGLKLTAKGNLPVAVVRSMVEAGIPEQLSRYPDFISRPRSEDDCLPVHLCRIIAELGGFVHKQKGRLLPRKRILTLAQQGQWGQVYLHLLECAISSFNRAYMDRHEEFPGIQMTAPFTLWLLHRSGSEWQDESAFIEDWLHAFPALENEMQVRSDLLARRMLVSAMSHRLLNLYQWFGLLEQSEQAGNGTDILRSFRIRKSALFDQVVRFPFGQ